MPEQRDVTALPLEAPYFVLQELRNLRKALNGAMTYVAPVGLSEHATATWREAKSWQDRLDSLIEEYEEWEQEVAP